jgi:hypothetical protein
MWNESVECGIKVWNVESKCGMWNQSVECGIELECGIEQMWNDEKKCG